jgi:hypothetical protein
MVATMTTERRLLVPELMLDPEFTKLVGASNYDK